MTPAEAIEKAASRVGGKAVLARLLNVRPPTVSQWSSGSRPVPAERALQIEELTEGEVRREALCPTFPWKVAASSGNQTPEAANPDSDRRAQLAPDDHRGRRTTDPTGAEIETLRDCAEQARAVADRLAG